MLGININSYPIKPGAHIFDSIQCSQQILYRLALWCEPTCLNTEMIWFSTIFKPFGYLRIRKGCRKHLLNSSGRPLDAVPGNRLLYQPAFCLQIHADRLIKVHMKLPCQQIHNRLRQLVDTGQMNDLLYIGIYSLQFVINCPGGGSHLLVSPQVRRQDVHHADGFKHLSHLPVLRMSQ